MDARWDIFCNVIDNYGDIGIAWRLARGLAQERRAAIRLWVDDLRAFRHIWPAIDPNAEAQCCEGVEVRAWRTPFGDAAPAAVVIEAFGCALPEVYLEAMGQRQPPPVWINLEYLSAEAWVDDHHGLPSPHPRLPLTKHFFFPGFTSATGGLLVEPDLAECRDAFQRSGGEALWAGLGLGMPGSGELRVSLFAYENPALPGLLDAWAADPLPVTCLVPEGRVVPQLEAWFDASRLEAGDMRQRGSLRVHILPFSDQTAYDRLLWACGLNFVRGEDSCVRGQWAARPLVWHAYPQAEGAHWAKLEALRARYVARLPASAARAVTDLWRCWNGVSGAPDMGQAWRAWRREQAAIERHARDWPAELAAAGRLTGKLADFVESRLK